MLKHPIKLLILALTLLQLSACGWRPWPACPECPVCPPPRPDMKLPEAVEYPEPLPAEPVAPPPPATVPVAWSAVEGWQSDDPSLALNAFLRSCGPLRRQPRWQAVCTEASTLNPLSEAQVRTFFETRFTPHELRKADGETTGLATGYYVPDLRASRQPSPAFSWPLYRRPDDLLVVDLREVYPALAGYRLRGRLDGQKIVPYWDRDAIDSNRKPLAGLELAWVDDPVELFFLQIQGSGLIRLEDGSLLRVNYADQNGHPYRSVAKWLIDRGAMSRDQMSMQNIKGWAQANPNLVHELLSQNPSYVFFRELPLEAETPPGALGVPLTPGRSVAVDPRYPPLGAPVFVATTSPSGSEPLYRLMMAQDTGGAIKGEVRIDFFWGMGERAGIQAGRMKQPLKMWVLLPVEDGAS